MLLSRPLSILLLLLAGSAACTGQVLAPGDTPLERSPAGGGSDPADPGDPVGGSTPGAEAPPCDPALAQARLRRLTEVQYRRTVEAAFGAIFEASDFPRFDDAIPTIGLASDPDNLRVDALLLERMHADVEGLADRVLARHAEVRACVDAGGAGCLQALSERLARALWRRPVEAEEAADLEAGIDGVLAAGGSSADAARFVVEALALAPSTLYRRELGGPGGALDPFERASALAYTLWNAPPDERLLGRAASGALARPDVLAEEARRMAEDPRFAAAMTDFVADVLKLDALADKDKIPELGLTPAVRDALTSALREDLQDLFTRPGARLFDPLAADTFRVDPLTEAYLGVDAGGQREPRAMPDGERHGVLTHPAFLAVHSGAGDSGIVKRGVFVLEQLLCVKLGAPPDDISPVDRPPPDFDPDRASSRERLQVLHSAQAECQGCHQYIDPAGFGFENYDAAGRWRTFERGDIPIDASGTLSVGGETLRFQDGVDYARALAGSRTLRRCLLETFLTHALGGEADRCEAEAFVDAAQARGAELAALAELLVSTPSFTARAAEEDDR